jgi:hypothetical protein
MWVWISTIGEDSEAIDAVGFVAKLLWSTKQMEDGVDRELVKVRDRTWYICFGGVDINVG